MGVLSSQHFSCEDALVFGLVGQHRAAHDVADGHDVLDIGFKAVVDHNSALLVNMNSSLVESKFVSEGSPASRDEDVVALESLAVTAFHRLNDELAVCSVVGATDNLVGSEDLDALLGEDFVEGFGEFLIERGNDLVKELNHSNVAAEALVN